MTITKTIEYYINGEKVTKEVEYTLTDNEVINARIQALKLLVANWTATDDDKDELTLLK